jgi:hypothetical protein
LRVPEQLAADLAGTIARTGALIHETISAALVLSPEHARLLAAAGWSKADVRAVLGWPELVAAGKDGVSSRTRWRLPADHPDALPVSGTSEVFHVLTSPEAVLVVVAGAGNAGVSAVVETFGARGGPPPVVRVRDLGPGCLACAGARRPSMMRARRRGPVDRVGDLEQRCPRHATGDHQQRVGTAGDHLGQKRDPRFAGERGQDADLPRQPERGRT